MTESPDVKDKTMFPLEIGVFLGVKIIESPYVPPLKTFVRNNNRHAYLKLSPKFKNSKSK